MAIPLTDVKAQYAPLRDELKDRIAEVLDSGRFILGPEVKAFEEEAASARPLLTEPADDVGPPGSDCLHFDRETFAPEPGFHEGGHLGLGPGRIAGPVDARDAHEGPRQLHHLVRVDLAEDLRQRGHNQSGTAIPAGRTG